jgi:hypothetical protein
MLVIFMRIDEFSGPGGGAEILMSALSCAAFRVVVALSGGRSLKQEGKNNECVKKPLCMFVATLWFLG